MEILLDLCLFGDMKWKHDKCTAVFELGRMYKVDYETELHFFEVINCLYTFEQIRQVKAMMKLVVASLMRLEHQRKKK